MDPFRADNTEGYNASQLLELNARFWEEIEGLDYEEGDSTWKGVCDRVQQAYDSEQE